MSHNEIVQNQDGDMMLEARLLDLIPKSGSVGNVTLLRTLKDEGWSEDQYWTVRQRLMGRGILTTGRGRGGSVRRAQSPASLESVSAPEAFESSAMSDLGADVIELPLAGGGRLIVIAQGRPVATDIGNLNGLLLERYSEFSIEAPSADAQVSGSPPDEATEILVLDEVQEEFADVEIGSDFPDIAPARRAYRSEDIESLCILLIQSIQSRHNVRRDQSVIVDRYGLGLADEQTLDAIGKKLDVTREYVRQIEAKVFAQWAENPEFKQKARDALSRWMRQTVLALSATGALLATSNLEALQEDRSAVDGWIKLALDVAFPMSGAGKLTRQMIALADLALHRYRPFGVNCWVAEPQRATEVFPNVEAWLEELDSSSQSLPLPADTFASVLGVDPADVIAVATAHPRFDVYAGYLFRGYALTISKRGVRAHVLALNLSPGAAPISQFDLWKEYRQRFSDIDPCSSNDIRIAVSDVQRGAAHLFILDNNNSLFALGEAASQHGLDLNVRFPQPESNDIEQAGGLLAEALRQGPATAEALAESLDLEPQNLISQLGQRSDFVSITPRYYGLAEHVKRVAAMEWSPKDLIEDDALALIGCRQAGDVPREIYSGWTPAYEKALCIKANDGGWACFPQLLWACEPDYWPMPEEEKSFWRTRKSLEAQPPKPVSLPSGSRLPDAERLLRFLLVVRQKGAISMGMANRVTRPRGPLQQVNGTLLAILARVGALQTDAESYWATHQAGPESERWYSMLADEYLQNGKLTWTQGVCLAMVQEAVSTAGKGWASGQEWTTRIRSWALERGVEFASLQAQVASANESDEAYGVAEEEETPDISIDLLSSDSISAPVAEKVLDSQPSEVETPHRVEELAKLVSEVAREGCPDTDVPLPSNAPVPSVESISVLVAKAQGGDSEAQYRLSKQLEAGVGAAPNPQAAAYWLQRAADAQHVPACVRFGRLLLTGQIGSGSQKERQLGLLYLNAGTKVGNATACYLVGLAYRDGGLTRKNPQAALRLLKRAARSGHGKAAYALAIMLRERMDGWVPDTLNLLRVAAGKGVGEAITLLGKLEKDRLL